jgi:hypothetical protein
MCMCILKPTVAQQKHTASESNARAAWHTPRARTLVNHQRACTDTDACTQQFNILAHTGRDTLGKIMMPKHEQIGGGNNRGSHLADDATASKKCRGTTARFNVDLEVVNWGGDDPSVQ